mmetsp:Transcript_28141/g.54911  ORF Transcript_28141/g.54911 Transcript_28141/m.54911 type:complete len:208 (+) Transcript_28141:37-660(+)
MQGLELPFYLGPASLAFYPLFFYFLVGFCSGEFSDGMLGAYSGVNLEAAFPWLRVKGVVLPTEGLLVALVAAWNWVSTLRGGRTYHLPDGAGGTVQVRKWDPDHASLALSCLVSPVQAFYLLVPEVIRDAEGIARPGVLMLLVATAHGYMGLLLAHMFLRREGVQMKINNSAYAQEVTFRNDEVNRRRVAEREVVEGWKHRSSVNFK